MGTGRPLWFSKSQRDEMLHIRRQSEIDVFNAHLEFNRQDINYGPESGLRRMLLSMFVILRQNTVNVDAAPVSMPVANINKNTSTAIIGVQAYDWLVAVLLTLLVIIITTLLFDPQCLFLLNLLK